MRTFEKYVASKYSLAHDRLLMASPLTLISRLENCFAPKISQKRLKRLYSTPVHKYSRMSIQSEWKEYSSTGLIQRQLNLDLKWRSSRVRASLCQNHYNHWVSMCAKRRFWPSSICLWIKRFYFQVKIIFRFTSFMHIKIKVNLSFPSLLSSRFYTKLICGFYGDF